VILAGADVLEAQIDMPPRRRWVIEAKLATDTAPSGRVTFEAGDFSLSGTIARARVHLGTCSVWVVGGAGGLSASVSMAYRDAQLRHPLEAIRSAAGETLDTSIASSLLTLPLASWDIAARAGVALDALADEAGRQAGEPVNWRMLASGALWMGVDAWPAASLPDHSQVIDEIPDLGVIVIGCAEPSVLPGVDLASVGRVRHVTHRIDRERVRTEVALWS